MTEDFAELARTLKSVMSEGQGFALLMQLDGQYHYASIANRDDVRATLTEWLARNGARVNVRDPSETDKRARARMKLEAKCVELGHLLEKEGHRLVFFLFDYGEGGHLAWWSNASDAPEVVRHFLAMAKET
jgi:hypothetical protein